MGEAPTSPLEFATRTLAPTGEQHAVALKRLRTAFLMGLVVWPSFAPFDLLFDRFVYPGTLHAMLALRGIGTAVIGVAYLWVRFEPSPKVAAGLTTFTFVSGTVVQSLMAVRCGGISSILACAVPVIMVARALTLSEPWWRSAPTTAAMTLAFPLTAIFATPFIPGLREQFSQPGELVLFLFVCSLLLSTAGFLTATSHMGWSLRKQLFAAKNLGRYKLTRKIGEGGMGEVWAAHHATLKRDVAIKVLKLGEGAADTAGARFLREVQATTELTHTNTIRVFDFGATDDGFLFYVMELLDGMPLSRLVKQGGPLPPPRAVHLVKQAARALAEAHARGIVHRDIKPDNLFLTVLGGEHDVIKVLDFGIARLDRSGEETLTATGQIAGTPAYISPEAASGEAIDARADVYSLGMVLYFLLAGRRPFDRGSSMAMINAARDELPVPPSQKLGAELPAKLEAVVMTALEKDPRRRYADGAALAAALEACDDVPPWTQQDAREAWKKDQLATTAPPPPPPSLNEARTVAD